MALPSENRTPKVIAAQEALKKMSPEAISALPSLGGEDFKAFGMLIQHFSFIDLNLRRALELFWLSKMLPKSVIKQYPNLPDSRLVETLVEVVKGMDEKAEDVPTALTWLELISKTRGYRNLVGHFAGKRFPDQDVYVFASKSDQDARRILGSALAAHHLHTAVAGRSEFVEMVKSVEQAQLWLGTKIPEWDERYLAPEQTNVGL